MAPPITVDIMAGLLTVSSVAAGWSTFRSCGIGTTSQSGTPKLQQKISFPAGGDKLTARRAFA